MKIEYNTKEQLTTEYEKAMKEFENWNIERDTRNSIGIYKNGEWKGWILLGWGENNQFNLSNLAWNMAEAMGDLMDTKDRLNDNIPGFSFNFDCQDNEFWRESSSYYILNSKIFKTQKIMEEAFELANNSQVIKDYINEMRGI